MTSARLHNSFTPRRDHEIRSHDHEVVAKGGHHVLRGWFLAPVLLIGLLIAGGIGAAIAHGGWDDDDRGPRVVQVTSPANGSGTATTPQVIEIHDGGWRHHGGFFPGFFLFPLLFFLLDLLVHRRLLPARLARRRPGRPLARSLERPVRGLAPPAARRRRLATTTGGLGVASERGPVTPDR